MSIIRGHLLRRYGELVSIFAGALEAGLQWTDANARRRPQEPDYVYGTFYKSVNLIDSGLRAMLADTPVSASVSGVYCHQSPKVRWDAIAKKGSVELGDLLVVVMSEEDGTYWNNALLFQAKVDYPPFDELEDDQFRLYNEWPDFEYLYGPNAGEERCVDPKMFHAGAQYLFYGRRHVGVGLWAALAERNDTGWPTFGPLPEVMAQACLGGSGREFATLPMALRTVDWDRVIWDLLLDTASAVTNRSNVGVRRGSRGNGIPVGTLRSSQLWTQAGLSPHLVPLTDHEGGLPSEPFRDYSYDENFGGISTVVISLSDRSP